MRPSARPGGPEERRGALARGHFAESLAALALRLKGWRILARNLRTPFGEIDIVARRGDLVALVEVKARPTLEACVEAVTPLSQRRILAAGEWWVGRQRDAARLSWRGDIVAVRPWRWPVHLPDMF